MNTLGIIFLAGGCFWGVEEFFSRLPGVVEVTSGYAQSQIEEPDYRTVCSGKTGAAETVKIIYDPDQINLKQILDQYFKIIDPFSINKQGNDIGTQYRTGIYWLNPEDEKFVTEYLRKKQDELGTPLAVESEKLKNFWPAEEYHQKYLKKNPAGYCHINLEGASSEINECQKWQKPDAHAVRSRLTSDEWNITQLGATETPFTGRYWNNHAPGIYVDVVTGEPLFSSSDKYDSGTGWPSFTRPIEEKNVVLLPDNSHGMQRTEVKSKFGASHLGHVFPDGPRDKGGMRYCLNSGALRFIPLEQMESLGYGAWIDRIKE